MDVTFSDDMIGIDILVWHHLGTPLLARALLMWGLLYMDYCELMGVIKSYVMGSFLSNQLIIEDDSLLVVHSLSPHGDNFSKLGALSSHFLSNIDPSSTVFSHILRSGNCPTHLLASTALCYNIPWEWSRNIASDIAHAILVDINNI